MKAPCSGSQARALLPIYMLGFTTLHDSRRYAIPRCMGPSHPDTKARCTGDDDTPLFIPPRRYLSIYLPLHPLSVRADALSLRNHAASLAFQLPTA